MPIIWGQAYETDGQFYWCTNNIPHLRGRKIAVPVPVIAYGKGDDPYVPFLLITINHDNILYKYKELQKHQITQVSCLHFNLELWEAFVKSQKKIKSDIFQPQKLFEELMENYDLYYWRHQ
jgi:hypothetical protein